VSYIYIYENVLKYRNNNQKDLGTVDLRHKPL
jgi:hypothetical protein